MARRSDNRRSGRGELPQSALNEQCTRAKHIERAVEENYFRLVDNRLRNFHALQRLRVAMTRTRREGIREAESRCGVCNQLDSARAQAGVTRTVIMKYV